MRVGSPGSLVTTGAWWRTAVTMTIASTTLAVPEAAQARPASQAGGLVVGEDVAGLEDPGDLVLGTAAPGLGQDDDRDERPDARSGQFVVQGEEVWVDAFPSGDPSLRAALAHLGLRAPAANWRPWLALAAAHLMAYGDTLVRDAVLV